MKCLKTRIPLLRTLAYGLLQGCMLFSVMGYLYSRNTIVSQAPHDDSPEIIPETNATSPSLVVQRKMITPGLRSTPLLSTSQQEEEDVPPNDSGHYTKIITPITPGLRTVPLETPAPTKVETSPPKKKVEFKMGQNVYNSTKADETLLGMDIMVPASNIDSKLKKFASRLGLAVAAYYYDAKTNPKKSSQPTISKFRLLVTRFSPEEFESSAKLQKELARRSGLPLDQVIMVHSDTGQPFSRSRALNLMHRAVCDLDTCLISRVDVDMDIQKEFFVNSVEGIYLEKTVTHPPPGADAPQWEEVRQSANLEGAAYFPIVFSAYNPKGVELVTEKLGNLPKYSQHRGHWRDRGTGMYVLRGSDAALFEFDEKFEGWGGEDTAFYKQVAKQRRIVRQNEPGLVHMWHTKSCKIGKDGLTGPQVKACRYARMGEEGSKLVKELLREKGLLAKAG